MLKQSERAATPFLISKQPYFLPFFYVTATSPSLFFRLAYVRFQRASGSHYSREPRRFITPTYFSALNVPAILLGAPISSLALFSPTFAILSPVLGAVLRSYSCCSHLITAATFDPRVVSVAWPARFSFQLLHPLHIIFLANSLIHSLRRRYLRGTVHRGDPCDR